MALVKLYGKLGKKYGKEWNLDVHSVKEAARALIANVPAIEKDIANGEYHIFVNKRDIGEKEVEQQLAPESIIKIVPVTAGSKRGGFIQIILGVVLIIVGIFLAPVLQAAAPYIISAGVSLTIGGIAALLTPVPKVDEPTNVDEKPSYFFDRAINTHTQGAPLPIGYGQMIIGSAVASVDLTTTDIL